MIKRCNETFDLYLWKGFRVDGLLEFRVHGLLEFILRLQSHMLFLYFVFAITCILYFVLNAIISSVPTILQLNICKCFVLTQPSVYSLALQRRRTQLVYVITISINNFVTTFSLWAGPKLRSIVWLFWGLNQVSNVTVCDCPLTSAEYLIRVP